MALASVRRMPGCRAVVAAGRYSSSAHYTAIEHFERGFVAHILNYRLPMRIISLRTVDLVAIAQPLVVVSGLTRWGWGGLPPRNSLLWARYGGRVHPFVYRFCRRAGKNDTL